MSEPYVHNDGSECLWDIHDQKWVRMHPLYPLRDLSPDLLRFLADEKAEEAAPHCATCRCGEGEL